MVKDFFWVNELFLYFRGNCFALMERNRKNICRIKLIFRLNRIQFEKDRLRKRKNN